MAESLVSSASTSARAASRRFSSTASGEVEASADDAARSCRRRSPDGRSRIPDAWWQATRRVDQERARRASPARASSSIGISGQMHSSVFLDAQGEVIRPALLWCDGRTTAECREITERVGGERRLRDLASQPGARGLHAAQGALAAQSRARGVRAPRHGAAGQGLHPLSPDRRRSPPSRPTRRRR